MLAPAATGACCVTVGGSAISSWLDSTSGGCMRAGRLTSVVVTLRSCRQLYAWSPQRPGTHSCNDMLTLASGQPAPASPSVASSIGEGWVLTAYSRVTVVSGQRKVDLALPSALPVADVVPQVLRYCLPPGEASDTAWTLARLGGVPLSLNQTLAEAGVLDGEVLELRGQSSSVRPALVEDVRDALEDTVDAAGGWWNSRTTVTFALGVGAVALAFLAGAVWLDLAVVDGDRSIRIAASVAAALTALALTAWAGLVSHAWTAQLCAGVAMAWGYLTGDGVAEALGAEAPTQLVLAMALVGLVAGAARGVTAAATPHLAAATVLVTTGVAVAVVQLAGVDTAQVHRVAPVACLLAVGVAPRLSLSVGGLASADYRVRHAGVLSDQQLVSRQRQSNGLLVGSTVGIALVVVWGSLHLTASESGWDRYLAVSVGFVALLRSRVFSRVQHLLALRVAAVIVLAAQLLRLTDDLPALQPWLVVLCSLGILALVALSSLQMSDITRARVKRVLNVVEFLLVVDMVVLTCGAVGLFATFSEVV